MNRLLILITLILAPAIASADENNVMENFRYTSCSASDCVEVSAHRAWISFVSGGFTTQGPTRMRRLELDGRERNRVDGLSATLNPQLGLVIVELEGGEVEMYSLKPRESGDAE